MWLKLDTGVGIIHFRVRNYRDNQDDYNDWCTIDLIIESNVINYALRDDEALEVGELIHIEKTLDETLAGQGDGVTVIEPMEPYMLFEFNPMYDNIVFPNMIWKIILWDNEDAPSDSTINLFIFGAELKMLSKYLKYARGQLKVSDSEIAELIDKGIICEE